MAYDGTQQFQAGQSGLIARIPEAEPAVRAWREQLDPSAHAGVSAHVTVLYPFLDASRIDESVCSALRETLTAHQSFEVRFDRCGRFPGVLYLTPEPDTPFRHLTQAIVTRWPETPPFGGQFEDPIPHLTITQGQDAADMDKAEADLLRRLPITAHISTVDLFIHDGTRWRQHSTFPLS
ncbi:2'-5' RNA ligase family protein [Streptomyces sp. NPDC005728]|uniref:2'-5' RNA ligase family protein n=1 Tax=Streptomyces sp. NPDC005728 TaxID=3157054 RepID=UPI0033D68D37